MQLILFLLVVILAYQNNANLNVSKNQVIIVALIAYYFLFMQKEKFTLTSAFIPNTTTPEGKPSLVNETFYDTGVLDTTKQIQTVNPARNGGIACGAFPTKVYRVSSPQPPVNATCRIGGVGGPSIAPGLQAVIDENENSHYIFAANQTPVLGLTIKNNPNL